MPFNSPPELRTFRELSTVLGATGYVISQKARALDYLEAAAANPAATWVLGPSAADYLLPTFREAAGPFKGHHPWLEPDDWSYAMRCHFDFVVHAPLDDPHPLQPMFAVEFDDASHSRPEVAERDRRKNRLCAAAGLPLVRIDFTHLHSREHVTTVRWLAELWADYRTRMPELLAERDAEIAEMSQEELDQHGHYLLCERPDLDVELIFRLEHPFPPVTALAQCLGEEHGFYWNKALREPPKQIRWSVGTHMPPIPSLSGGTTERWRCWLELEGPEGQRRKLQGLHDVRTAYPLLDQEPTQEEAWELFMQGRLAHLPAGPFTTASNHLGEALCLHNALVEVKHFLRRNDQPR